MLESPQRNAWNIRLSAWLVRWRVPLVLLGIAVFVVAYPASQRLEFDRTITAMFSPEEQTFKDYMLLREHFGSNTVIMFVYHDPELMSEAGLERNRAVAATIAEVEGVTSTLSTSLLDDSVRKLQPIGLKKDLPALLQGKEGSLGRRFNQLFAGYTHSDERNFASVVTVLSLDAPDESLDALEQFAADISAGKVESIGQRSAYLMGEPVLIQKGFTLVEDDGLRLATLTIVLLSFVVAISLGSVRFVALTAILIGWTVVVTRGIMVWSNINLSLISAILTAIVTVIVVATVLHLGIRFRRLRARGYAPEQAAIASISRLIIPILVACLTDAGGFIALQASTIMPVQQFGTSISIAALVVIAGVLIWTPALMTFSDVSSLSESRLFQHFRALERASGRWLRHGSRRIGLTAINHPKTCISIAATTLVFTYIGLINAKSETSFLDNFRDDNKMVISYREVEDHFGGAGVWDVVVEAPLAMTPQYLEQVKALESDLMAIDAEGAKVNKIMSLASLDSVFEGGTFTSMLPSATRLSFMGTAMPSVFDSFLSRPQSDTRFYRIMLRSREQNESEARNELISQVTKTVERHTSSEAWQASLGVEPEEDAAPLDDSAVTGYYVLTSKLVSSLVGDQWRSFSLAGLLVGICIVLYTRSLAMSVAALIANLLPCAFVLAVPGLIGERINMGATLIAAVSIGLSIDGSVHFLAAFRRFRSRGHPVRRSAIHAAGGIGVPLMWATAALVIGFAALSTSEFVPIATFGTLVSATLAVGTLVNLTLLPVLVCAWIRD